MKIFTKDAVYVQKNDVAYLNTLDDPIPASVYEKIYTERFNIINNRNRYEFVKYTTDAEKDFFKKMDWMLDYDEVKDLNIEGLINLGVNLTDKLNEIGKQCNESQGEIQQKYIKKYHTLQFKVYSIRDYIWYKKGKLEFNFPSELGIKPEIEEEIKEEVIEEQPVQEENQEKPKILKRIVNVFKRGVK